MRVPDLRIGEGRPGKGPASASMHAGLLVTEQLPGPRAFSRVCGLPDLLVRPRCFPSGRLVGGEYRAVAGATPSLAR